jgi:hypothetical protein
MALRRGGKLFFEWIQKKRAGDVVSRTEVMKATKWEESTLDTYLGKGMLGSLVREHGNSRLRVTRNGNDVSAASLERVFSQRRSA